MRYILYNPLAKNNKGAKSLGELKELRLEGAKILNFTELNVREFYTKIHDDDEIVITGGDGTLNYFVNQIYDIKRDLKHYLYKFGSGNDFVRDINLPETEKLIDLNPYMERLPRVLVNGKEYHFVNNAAFGLDGYVCEKVDEAKVKGEKNANYSLVALKGLLYDYKNTNAKVTVDGKEYEYEDVLMAPTMKGRYYGGGIKIAPEQNRLDEEGMLSLVVVHNLKKIQIPIIFPKIYSGNYVKHSDVVSVVQGKHIKVEFNEPRAMQIDGETILGVTEYEVWSD